MIDKENNILVKIRNENQFIKKNKYEIEMSNEKVTDLDILTILYGSNIKLKAVIIGAVAVRVISIGIVN